MPLFPLLAPGLKEPAQEVAKLLELRSIFAKVRAPGLFSNAALRHTALSSERFAHTRGGRGPPAVTKACEGASLAGSGLTGMMVCTS